MIQLERRTTRDVTIHVRVEPDVRRRAEAAAAAAGVTLSDLVRAGLTEVTQTVLRDVAGEDEGRDR